LSNKSGKMNPYVKKFSLISFKIIKKNNSQHDQMILFEKKNFILKEREREMNNN
jgi:hypothetical protein